MALAAAVNGSVNGSVKHSDRKPVKAPPQRSCVICTDADIELVRPCRSCNTDYCVDCLVDMFLAATVDGERMPPRCCHLIQIHTIINCLTNDQGKTYRAKFEEWITPVKTYCPSPTCSAFISEQRVPVSLDKPITVTPTPSLISLLSGVIANVTKDPQARFFRGEMDIELLPGYTKVVERPMDLSMIQDQLSMSLYKSTSGLTKDMSLIVHNAKEYNGPSHPVAAAADELFAKYLQEISNATDRLVGVATTPVTQPIFSCAKCHIAICSGCKQVEHIGSPCDTSTADHEIAMLEQFGYKRCPRCKAGVKKMFGCSHMRCMCGAHWCYYCQRSVDECDGSCNPGTDEDEDDYDSELDDEDEEEEMMRAREFGLRPESHRIEPSATVATPAAVPAAVTTAVTAAAPATAPTVSAAADNAIVNLDAGARRWADAQTYDFGEEPEDEPFSQIWSCKHKFEAYKTPADDGFDRGDLNRMECNRCFAKVEVQMAPPTGKSPKKRMRLFTQRERKEASSQTEGSPKIISPDKEAWECARCRVLVCVSCRDKYKMGIGNE